MAKIGRPLAELRLTDQERADLLRLVRRKRTNPQVAFRAQIILACCDMSNSAVARKLHTSNPTVGKWRKRFVLQRIDGLYDEPRPGAPRKISDEDVEQILALSDFSEFFI